MDTAAWYAAAHPPKVICLGLTLRPYSIGAEILLQRENSALVFSLSSPGGEGRGEEAPSITYGDLALACLICSQTYRAADRFLHSRWQQNLFRRLWLLRFRRHIPDLQRELDIFCEYRSSAAWQPAVNRRLDGRPFGSPWQWRMLAFLMHAFHWTEDRALNYPLSRASALYAAWMEFEGRIQLFNTQDDALFAKLEQMEAEESRTE